MATSNKLTGAEWNDLPLFAEGTPASLSAQQVTAKVKKILATCGLGYDKPLANYDPDTQFWKMSAGIFPWGEQPSLPILPPSGMTRNGELCQQPAWEPLTGGIASLSWPTPTTQEVEHTDMILTESGRRKSKNGKTSHSVGLADAVRMWPTPTAHPDNSNVNGKFKNPTLGDAVRMWPTPRAALSETRNHTVYARSTDKPQNLENKVGTADPSAVGGKLNPTWVEWLMGFPLGWTDLED